jgi:hypothetical protein
VGEKGHVQILDDRSRARCSLNWCFVPAAFGAADDEPKLFKGRRLSECIKQDDSHREPEQGRPGAGPEAADPALQPSTLRSYTNTSADGNCNASPDGDASPNCDTSAYGDASPNRDASANRNASTHGDANANT